MNTLEAIAARHSYRGQFLPTPVPREHLKTIVEAGFHAPSGCNKQTTSFIAVDDPALMAKLHAVIDPPVGETAPAMICVLTRRIIAPDDKSYFVQDYACVSAGEDRATMLEKAMLEERAVFAENPGLMPKLR